MGISPQTSPIFSRQVVTLRDGTTVPVRAITPADAAALQQFHRGLSDSTIFQRHNRSLPELPDKQANYFTGVDGVNRIAIVALKPDDPSEIIAVIRYDRDDDSQRAEYAAVVTDRWQGRGLGWSLTHLLIDIAQKRGIETLYAVVRPDNAPMLGLLRDLGLPRRIRWEDDVEIVEVTLAPPFGYERTR